jgi:tRNA pseudouridine13 synthase
VTLPLLTDALPGCGGATREPEDFVVEELPAYLPCGEGEHCFAQVEKRDLTTPQAIAAVCKALGLQQSEAGYAGLKDRRGVTRQWISFFRADPQKLGGLELPGLRVLEAALHKNKLRTGHLRGNRFAITLRGVAPGGLERAGAILERLVAEELANYFGEQRFGRQGDNAEAGLRLLRGEGRPVRDRVQRRLLVSALQSQLFNEVLARRLLTPGAGLRGLLGGEVLQRVDSEGLFVSEDSAVDGERLRRRELRVTGPICGPRTPLPLEGSPARALEEAVFAEHQLSPESFSVMGRLARGGRRPVSVPVADAEVCPGEEPDTLRVRFVLPPGAYATVLLRELCKSY